MITYEQTLADLRKIAADEKAANGDVDYVYERVREQRGDNNLGLGIPRCLYVHKAAGGRFTPGCIIGVLLATVHNVSLGRLEELQFAMAVAAAPNVIKTLGLDFSNEASDFLGKVQERQDDKVPWVEAVEASREWVERGRRS